MLSMPARRIILNPASSSNDPPRLAGRRDGVDTLPIHRNPQRLVGAEVLFIYFTPILIQTVFKYRRLLIINNDL
jgi:hypothetical protein